MSWGELATIVVVEVIRWGAIGVALWTLWGWKTGGTT